MAVAFLKILIDCQNGKPAQRDLESKELYNAFLELWFEYPGYEIYEGDIVGIPTLNMGMIEAQIPSRVCSLPISDEPESKKLRFQAIPNLIEVPSDAIIDLKKGDLVPVLKWGESSLYWHSLG